MKLDYTPQYYARLSEGSRVSAAVVVPLVLDLVRPMSVVDVGCGTGAWLAAFKRQGVADVLGIDGPHIEAAQLEIEPSEFVSADLAQPLDIDRKFDLAVSLEVAEHLPEAASDQFIDVLTRLAPAVLFSAAVPHQGGEHHVNEQWPAFWIERFAACGFGALDPFRRLLWQRPDVDWWYAQNLLLFVRQDRMPEYQRRQSKPEQAKQSHDILPLVHPQNYLQQAWRIRVLHAAVDLATAVPAGERLILADEDRFGTLFLPGRRVLPFLECGGIYAGPPRDDQQAVAELCRMQQSGATFLAIGWPAFWWLTHYRDFAAHLEQHHTLLLRNERVVLFALDRE